MNNSIEIKGLNKFYGKKQALFDVNLSIQQGMFGLLGRNGAGKTTLMKTLATLLQKKNGVITVCGVPIENAKEIRRIIGYLPQEFSMYPSMKVGEAMKYLAILSGLSGSQRKERIDALLKKVNLTEHRDKKVKALSGGMKRRLGIAQALLNNPKVLIVDEPTAGLDPEERVRFRNLLSEIAEDKIVILSTHIVSDVETIARQIIMIRDHRIYGCDQPADLCARLDGKLYEVPADFPLTNEDFVLGERQGPQGTVIRLATERPLENIPPAVPNLEDAFLYIYRDQPGR